MFLLKISLKFQRYLGATRDQDSSVQVRKTQLNYKCSLWSKYNGNKVVCISSVFTLRKDEMILFFGSREFECQYRREEIKKSPVWDFKRIVACIRTRSLTRGVFVKCCRQLDGKPVPDVPDVNWCNRHGDTCPASLCKSLGRDCCWCSLASLFHFGYFQACSCCPPVSHDQGLLQLSAGKSRSRLFPAVRR